MDDLNLNNGLQDDGDDFNAAEVLLNRWVKKDAAKPSERPDPEEDADDADDKETGSDEGDNEQDEADEDDGQDQEDPQESEGDEDSDKDTPAAKKFVDDDDVYFKIPVDGAEHEVSAKDLKRLWGQEASLTRKSQEVSQQTKVVTERRSQYETALNNMYQKAVERAKPYQNIDMALAAKNLSNEDYTALKKDAEAAFNDVKFFEEELKGHIGKVTQEAQQAHAEAAKEAVKQLTDKESPSYIPDWSDQVYADLRDYGVKMGIPREQMDSSTSAPSFKILWMAQQYEKGKAVATKKATKVVGKKPMDGKGPKAKDGDRAGHAMKRLKNSGSVEDAAATLFERWGVQ
jgi:predicted metal-binding transcription factor (methanogenesis marker protein 9)